MFFRVSTKKKALKLGLSGWVKNEPDGSVSVEAQGDEEKLRELLSWCRQGPPSASVEKVDHSFEQTTKTYEDFEIIQ